ncbi:MAG: hypothetical protein MUE66_04215 [Acidimicrobiia bacterium]|jgi:hypothetical protein|nr:hypothetical protein [Acidimicrobiia bacterium]
MNKWFSNWSRRRKVVTGAALAGLLLVAGGTTGALAATGAFDGHSCAAVVGPEGEVSRYGDCDGHGQELGELEYGGQIVAPESGEVSGTFDPGEGVGIPAGPGDIACTAVVGPEGEVSRYGDCDGHGQELGELQFQGQVSVPESGMTSGTFPSDEQG